MLANRAAVGTSSEAATTAIQTEFDRPVGVPGQTLRGPLGDATQAMREFLHRFPWPRE